MIDVIRKAPQTGDVDLSDVLRRAVLDRPPLFNFDSLMDSTTSLFWSCALRGAHAPGSQDQYCAFFRLCARSVGGFAPFYQKEDRSFRHSRT